MSADNWAICPRCLNRARKAEDDALAIIKESRRQAIAEDMPIPESVFTAAEAAVKRVEPEDYRTFREDYEFYGVESGTVSYDYSGYCDVCELSLSFNDKHPIPGWEDE